MGEVAQRPDHWRRDEAAAQQPDLEQVVQPHRVLHAGLATRDLFDVPDIDQSHRRVGEVLEHLVDRFPLAASGLHRNLFAISSAAKQSRNDAIPSQISREGADPLPASRLCPALARRWSPSIWCTSISAAHPHRPSIETSSLDGRINVRERRNSTLQTHSNIARCRVDPRADAESRRLRPPQGTEVPNSAAPIQIQGCAARRCRPPHAD